MATEGFSISLCLKSISLEIELIYVTIISGEFGEKNWSCLRKLTFELRYIFGIDSFFVSHKSELSVGFSFRPMTRPNSNLDFNLHIICQNDTYIKDIILIEMNSDKTTVARI